MLKSFHTRQDYFHHSNQKETNKDYIEYEHKNNDLLCFQETRRDETVLITIQYITVQQSKVACQCNNKTSQFQLLVSLLKR